MNARRFEATLDTICRDLAATTARMQARRYVVLRPGPVPRLALLLAQEEER